MKKLLTILIALVILVVIAVAVPLIWYTNAIGPMSDEAKNINVTIEMGSGSSTIAKTLMDAGVISSDLAFKLYVKLNNISGFQAGEYVLSPNMNLETIAKSLKEGKVFEEQVKITFVEGKNMMWIAKRIAETTDNTEQDVYDLLKDKTYLQSLIDKYWFLTEDILNKNIYYALEGYLAPNTYHFSKNDLSVKTIFKTMLDQTEKILKDYKDIVQKSKYSIHEIMTMASIVELECPPSKDNENRKNTASVFYNRLKSGMSLGSDVTTYYAFKISMADRDLTVAELNSSNPYNTRGPNMGGKLPVGPICSASKSSIIAAIEPNKGEDLYFVADKNGKIYFTETYSEHVQVVNKLKKENMWYEYEK
ncbi:MAG: endolytic transglycosylase MltG [Clostridia bacterium]|nr:endolytic transglycosylase MltG [Clostridia bacterium]